jgi:hypothetical protein
VYISKLLELFSFDKCGRLRLEDLKFKINLGYIERPVSKKKKTKPLS